MKLLLMWIIWIAIIPVILLTHIIQGFITWWLERPTWDTPWGFKTKNKD